MGAGAGPWMGIGKMKHYDNAEIARELFHQDAKWGPDRTHSDEWWYAILGKEFGEIGKVLLEDHFDYPESWPGDIRQEVVQLVCVGLQWLNSMTFLEGQT